MTPRPPAQVVAEIREALAKISPYPWHEENWEGDWHLRNANNDSLASDCQFYPWVPDSADDRTLIAHAPGWLAECVALLSPAPSPQAEDDTQQVAMLKTLLSEARQKLADYEADFEATLAGECAPDEQHCACVPHLRREVERLKAALDSGRNSELVAAENTIERLTAERDAARAEGRREVLALLPEWPEHRCPFCQGWEPTWAPSYGRKGHAPDCCRLAAAKGGSR
jgi:hypothetical protein